MSSWIHLSNNSSSTGAIFLKSTAPNLSGDHRGELNPKIHQWLCKPNINFCSVSVSISEICPHANLHFPCCYPVPYTTYLGSLMHTNNIICKNVAIFWKHLFKKENKNCGRKLKNLLEHQESPSFQQRIFQMNWLFGKHMLKLTLYYANLLSLLLALTKELHPPKTTHFAG
jgi:hypothetical protein